MLTKRRKKVGKKIYPNTHKTLNQRRYYIFNRQIIIFEMLHYANYGWCSFSIKEKRIWFSENDVITRRRRRKKNTTSKKSVKGTGRKINKGKTWKHSRYIIQQHTKWIIWVLIIFVMHRVCLGVYLFIYNVCTSTVRVPNKYIAGG